MNNIIEIVDINTNVVEQIIIEWQQNNIIDQMLLFKSQIISSKYHNGIIFSIDDTIYIPNVNGIFVSSAINNIIFNYYDDNNILLSIELISNKNILTIIPNKYFYQIKFLIAQKFGINKIKLDTWLT